jgi:membrane-bound lytic murein transglycosylase B
VFAAAAISAFASSALAAGAATSAPISAERRAQEAAFMRSVKPNQTANDMTGNVLAHVGERVAYTCRVEEVTRSPVVVGQCGADSEPVDLYLKLPPGHWRVGDKIRVLGILDTPASWSDISGHTVYYPFVKAVFADRIR